MNRGTTGPQKRREGAAHRPASPGLTLSGETPGFSGERSLTRPRDTSLNSTVLALLTSSLGVGGAGHRTNGLTELAGTWTAEELCEFETAVAPLETVDDDMWA